MKELTLEHLAPYLPYKLRCLYTHTNKIGVISNVYSIGNGYDNNDLKLSIDHSDGEHIWMYKPILHPLSDLTKEIELHTEGQFIVGGERIREWFDLDPKRCQYDQFCYLLKHHYDVFGLIESGLAIDINTI